MNLYKSGPRGSLAELADSDLEVGYNCFCLLMARSFNQPVCWWTAVTHPLVQVVPWFP